jgi:ketosteroid isomerase-like protein
MTRTRTTLGSTDREIRTTLAQLLSALDADAEYDVRHEDFIAEMPQSGDRIRGRDSMRELQRAFPAYTKPTFTVRRITGAGEMWTIEAEGDYGGHVFHVVLIIELRDGKIQHETRYYAEPFEAPQWRAHLVDPPEQVAR